ncbi:MAG TPA: FAD-dependent oxidoreductase [Dongiaceae bacterium]|jgi:pyruvate/2-oxoglutarate dehydrogenase complex dihydrolipoamide dehydrogenase (E3) component|nr:FAD-dependent oxidoreductase [Dongiaceae bacterium]
MKHRTADICVIGAGSAGLSVAAGAAQLGASVVLIESGKMGGDCLNYGCVPSKALLAAAHRAYEMRHAAPFGISNATPHVDMARVRAHVAEVIAGIAPHDSVERFTGLGVRVIPARARFVAPNLVEADGTKIRARYFVVATGSRTALPAIPGLREVPFLTNETIFTHDAPIAHLIVIGGGPIGVEMAQAHARLGSRVTILEMDQLLPRDDPDAAALVRGILRAEGITILEKVQITSVARGPGGVRLETSLGPIEGSHLFLATGRVANLEDLNLDMAGVSFIAKGVAVDHGLRSTNRRIYALGDAAGGPAFTHIASYHAGIFIRRALFKLPAKVDYRCLPWVTYTDPEVAQLGLTEKGARTRHSDCAVIQLGYDGNDRARAERATEGFIKVMADKRGAILGVTIAGRHAGELLAPWCLAMNKRLKLSALAGAVLPYPTLAEIGKRAAGQYYTPKLFSPRVKMLTRALRWLSPG